MGGKTKDGVVGSLGGELFFSCFGRLEIGG